MPNPFECRHQVKKALVGIANALIRIQWSIVFCSALLGLLLFYLNTFSFQGSGSKGVAQLTASVNSIVSSHNSADNKTDLVTKQPIDPCLGRYIYVHDLPGEFNDDILKNCRVLIKWFDMCPSMPNNGMGPRLSNDLGVLQDSGWFNTNQFMLEVLFRHRMKQYACLTNNSASASAVFVPFYSGHDVSRHLWNANVTLRDATVLHLVKWLAEKKEWKRMWGRDHFLITGRIGWDFQRSLLNDLDWGNKLLFLPETKNMTVLGIESTYHPDYNNYFAVPYPTYFHPASDKAIIQWQERMRRMKRRHLVSFVGADRPGKPNSIRGELMGQCRAFKGKCVLLECVPGPDNECDDPSSVIELFQNSIFCLQPDGDSCTRRSIFDSIVAGCIPVFFLEESAYRQYMWHLPRNHTKYSVFIPASDFSSGKLRIEKVLLGFSEGEAVAMREEVIRLIPGIVYADPNARLENFEDAFDIAVKRILERVDTFRRTMRG